MKMPKMRKANRVINVEKNSVSGYLARGYEQISDNGEIEKYATGGKNISVAEHNKVVAQLDKFKQAKVSSPEDAEKIQDLTDEVKILTEENEKLTEVIRVNKNRGK